MCFAVGLGSDPSSVKDNGIGAQNGFLRCSIHAFPKLVFRSRFSEIEVCVMASELPHF